VQSWQRTIDFGGGTLTVQDSYATGSGTDAVFEINVPVRPTISGSTATAGDLGIAVLSPTDATLRAVDWTTVDEDYNSGWRIDISGGDGRYVVRLDSLPTAGDEVFRDGFD
jgi:hypothetical protein